ncbi:MAG: autotransporter outer membrane beta-barrel domain-containing protein [Rhizobiaceae bacterium]|nr:autotransporter outer membrane beta-barrel domain-containing protein [Rhizobiaceae bacterium]
MCRSGLPAARRLIAGFVHAIVFVLVLAGAAQADDCAALNGGTFTFTGPAAGANPFGAFHDGGTTFTVDAGRTVTFNVTVPANSLLRVSFGGQTQTVDNLGGGTAVMRSLTFTASAGSGSVTGTIRYEGVVQDTETLTIDVLCSGATTPGAGGGGDELGGLMDSLFQAVIHDPDLFGGLGVPQLGDCTGREAEVLRQVRARMAVLESIDPDSPELGLLGVQEQFLLLCVGDDPAASAVVPPDPCGAAKVNREAALALWLGVVQEDRDVGSDEVIAFGLQHFNTLSQEDQVRILGLAAEQERRREHIRVLEAEFNAAHAAYVDCALANGQELDLSFASAEPARADRAQKALDQLINGPVYGSFGALGYQPGSPVELAASDNGLAFAYDLNRSRQRIERAFGARALPGGLLGNPRFNMWLKGNVTFHIDPTGLLHRGTTVAVAGGASYRILRWLNAGIAARYAHANLFGGTGNGSADAWSVAAFAQAQMAQRLLFEAIVAYSGVTANATFAGGATGVATGHSWAGQARLSRTFNIGAWQVTPALGLSLINIQRDAFTASDGTVVAAANSTQTTLTLGPTFRPRQRYVLGDGAVTVRPEFGIDLFANLGKFDPLIGTGGTAVSSDTFGVTVRTGLGFAFAGGAAANINAAYAGVGGTHQAVSISANLRVPVGGR